MLGLLQLTVMPFQPGDEMGGSSAHGAMQMTLISTALASQILEGGLRQRLDLETAPTKPLSNRDANSMITQIKVLRPLIVLSPYRILIFSF